METEIEMKTVNNSKATQYQVRFFFINLKNKYINLKLFIYNAI